MGYLSRFLLLLGVFLPGNLCQSIGLAGQDQQLQKEEAEDYFNKWLNEDVVLIISSDERAVFEKLTTPEEREQFIEQFWFRRDADPSTPVNEFKDEHYRRIAYANERFSSGVPGWMTDRGRIYIIHGPPAEIEAHPAGGYYDRPSYEGGGSTVTFPFEVWRYRYIEGIGSDVELEFVDPSGSGEYRLSYQPEEKDALLFVPGAGLTLAEQMGLATKADRPYFSPGNRDTYPGMMTRAKDSPFARYETFATVQHALPIKYQDLKQMVQVNVQYNNLPFSLRQDYLRLNDHQVLVPITIQLQNKELTFKQEAGRHVARVAVYGLITSITNRVIQEFDDDLVTSLGASELEEGLLRRSIYQRIVPLDRKLRYKVDLVIKDLNSGKVGYVRQAISPPAFTEGELAASSLILADQLQPLPEIPTTNEMFVIGDVRVRPNIGKEFSTNETVGLYLQIYNVGLDQTTLNPSLQVNYRIRKGGQTQLELSDDSGKSVQFVSYQRVVLLGRLPLRGFEPGRYELEVAVTDRITGQEVTVRDTFSVLGESRAAR